MQEDRRIVIFAGTTEGRLLSEKLSEECIMHTVCVATEYGQTVMEDSPYARVHIGRLDENEIVAFIHSGTEVVVDATHPYAVCVSSNIQSACESCNIKYIRVLRQDDYVEPYSVNDNVSYYESINDISEAIAQEEGNVLLTTGSRDIAEICKEVDITKVYVRVLPSIESITKCQEAGIEASHIIAMHGPFSTRMNEAIIEQYNIKVIVTKMSGAAGGYKEKLEAARGANIKAFCLKRPAKETGVTISEAVKDILEGIG